MTDEQLASKLLIQLKADLRTLVTRDDYNLHGNVVLVGLLQFTEGLMRRAARVEPMAVPIFLAHLDTMREAVQRVASESAASTTPSEAWPTGGQTH